MGVRAAAQSKPNFVVILTDDQRLDTVRALGNSEIQTPNMDRLVRRGVAFTHACTQGGLTGAICMPSRAQLLTGRSVFRVHRGIVDRQQSPDPALRTFPEILSEQGYSTFATGKWHNGPKLFNRSFANGASIFFGGMSDHVSIPLHAYDPSGRYPASEGKASERFSSETFTDAALGFLNSRANADPFLLYIAYTSPTTREWHPRSSRACTMQPKCSFPEASCRSTRSITAN